MFRRLDIYNLGKRCVGFFSDPETAKEAVEDNACGIHECGHFNWCVIEEQVEGLYGMNGDHKEWWYEWKDEGFEEIEKPEELKIGVGWGMG